MTVQPAPRPAPMCTPHWAHEPRINNGDLVHPGTPHVLNDGLVETGVPIIDVSVYQHHLGFGIRFDQLFCKRARRHLTRAEGVEELVPFDSCEGRAFAKVLGIESLVPHFGITDI